MTSTKPSMPAEVLADEQKAIAQLKQGNLDGLAVLVEIHQVKAVHVALLIIGDLGTAEEVVQEAFLRAYRKIDQFDDSRPFSPWFLRSVINAALKVAARQGRAEPLDEPQDGNSVAQWLIDPAPEPQAIVEKAEIQEAIWQALKQLTPDQRAAVVLRYFLDEDESEMIRDLNRPRSTIKWWLHTARQRLRSLLRPFQVDEMNGKEAEHESE
jgi:RNA polymerase sigma-70 factor, ECF subfamily